jgi:CRP/FNR family transcriptional regulator
LLYEVAPPERTTTTPTKESRMTEEVLEEVYDVLRESTLLRCATDEGIRRMAASGTIRTFAKGELVITEGDPADGFGLILTGTIPSYQLSSDGRRLLYKSGERGDHVGFVSAVAGSRYPFYFEATSAATLAWFTRSALMKLMDAEPDVARALLTMFADWLTDSMHTNRTLMLDVPSRVASYLFGRALAVGTTVPEGLSVPLGIYKADLASYLSTVPETLSRAFATLTAEGLIDVHGRTVIVHDVGGLARRGEGLTEDLDHRRRTGRRQTTS